jgi:hypothetical protein
MIYHKNKEVTLPTPVLSAKYNQQKQIQTAHELQLAATQLRIQKTLAPTQLRTQETLAPTQDHWFWQNSYSTVSVHNQMRNS